jgi:ABC-2 type transport system ATP-binding protein
VKRFGRVEALAGVDLVVRRGAVFGFLGPNGAGKTTAIRILLDLIRPSAGSVRVFGVDCQRDTVAAHRLLGYLPAEPAFPSMTAGRYFEYVTRLRGGRVDGDYLARLVGRLELDLDRPIRALSRGNRQKVGLVQALMHRPDLVVLDEPTSGLDPLMQEVVEETLRDYAAEGRTVFFSSHVLAEVEQICDHVAMLRRGRVVDVFALEEQRRLAPHIVTVTFAVPPPPGAFEGLAGVRELEPSGAERRFEVRDGMDALVKRLAAFPILTLDSREPSLEELFLSLYGHEEPAGVA